MSRDRDQQLDRVLTQELRALSTPPGDHLDAETLAAWADGGLDAAGMASVETHLSSCPRCQSIAAVMTRAEPIAAIEPRRAFRIPAWWIPIAAGAAAVTIWMVVPQQRELATAPPAAPVAAVESAPPAAQASPATAPARDASASPQAKTEAPAREDRRERGAFVGNTSQPAARLEDSLAKENAGALAPAPQKEQAAIPAPAAPPLPPGAPAVAEAQRAAGRLTAAALEIVSPDTSRRWRISPAGVERSEDGGATWVIVRPAAGEVITAGTAPTGSICWLVGRAGLVLVTADGVTFARVPLPEGSDLASVSAADATSATVTTVDGRRFRTDDSGRTWRQIQA